MSQKDHINTNALVASNLNFLFKKWRELGILTVRCLLLVIFMDFISCACISWKTMPFLEMEYHDLALHDLPAIIDKLNRNRSRNLLGLNIIVGSRDKQKNLLFSLFFYLIFVWTTDKNVSLFKFRIYISIENRLCIIWLWNSLNLIQSRSL